jgi:hypothetical protein
MGTAFPQGSLIYDQVLRRDPQSQGATRYPQSVREVHKRYVRQIFESSESKVEVIYGTKAPQAILTDPSMEMAPFSLWGDYSGTIIFLIFEKSCQNAQMEFIFRKVLLPVYHPQRLFHATTRGHILARQERSVAAAAAMANVEHISNYYEGRLWTFLQPPSKQRHLETVLAQENARAISAGCITINQDATSTSTSTSSSKEHVAEDCEDHPDLVSNDFIHAHDSWEEIFSEKPHSNKKLAELLPRAIDEATNHKQEWYHPSDFPGPVREWWSGQKQILFYRRDTIISGTSDIVPILKECQKYQTTWEPAATRSRLTNTIDLTSLRQSSTAS